METETRNEEGKFSVGEEEEKNAGSVFFSDLAELSNDERHIGAHRTQQRTGARLLYPRLWKTLSPPAGMSWSKLGIGRWRVST